MFRELQPPPNEPQLAVVGELEASITGEPGVRTSWRGRGVYFGGGLTPQHFVRAPSQPNDEANLEVLRKAARINSRRAYGRARGHWEG